MKRMLLCSACKRHVFAGEPACPFCGNGFDSTHPFPEPSSSPALSRAERYAIGAAVALTFAATGCSKSEETPVTPELANSSEVATNSTNSPPEIKAPEPRRAEEPVRAEDAPPPSPFLVGSSAATPDPPPPDPTNAPAKLPVTAAKTARKPPPPPPPPDDLNDPLNGGNGTQRWHRPKCLPNGGCPPYGCVFPDDACDVLRV